MLILQNDENNAELLYHLKNCANCRQTLQLCRSLAFSGEKSRKADLSEEKKREIRRKVAVTIEKRSVRVLPFFQLRLLYSGAAVLAILLVGFLIIVARHPGAAGSSFARLAVDTVPEIEKKKDYVDDEIRSFRKRYILGGTIDEFEVRAEKIRKRIDFYSLTLDKDLKGIGSGKEEQERIKFRHIMQGVESGKEKTANENKA